MSIVKDNNNQKPAPSKHFVKPLLLAQNSLHVPSHVLLPRGSLFAHPYPESVHPFETHEDQSISELTAKTIARGNHLILDTNISQRTGEVSKHGRHNVHRSYHACDERNIGDFAVKSIPVLPFKAAVFCLILNTITPGAGKTKVYKVFMIPYPLLNIWYLTRSYSNEAATKTYPPTKRFPQYFSLNTRDETHRKKKCLVFVQVIILIKGITSSSSSVTSIRLAIWWLFKPYLV